MPKRDEQEIKDRVMHFCVKSLLKSSSTSFENGKRYRDYIKSKQGSSQDKRWKTGDDNKKAFNEHLKELIKSELLGDDASTLLGSKNVQKVANTYYDKIVDDIARQYSNEIYKEIVRIRIDPKAKEYAEGKVALETKVRDLEGLDDIIVSKLESELGLDNASDFRRERLTSLDDNLNDKLVELLGKQKEKRDASGISSGKSSVKQDPVPKVLGGEVTLSRKPSSPAPPAPNPG